MGMTERAELLVLHAQAMGRRMRRRMIGTILAFVWCLAWGLWGAVEVLVWMGRRLWAGH